MYADPVHKYNLLFSAFSTSPVSINANWPAVMPVGAVSAVNAATDKYVLAMVNPNPASP